MLDATPALRPSRGTKAFAAELARLNDAQRAAVEHPDGPVLVVAGPGTGKTQLLAARVGWLLQHLDLQVQAREILCLTYTEAAAQNMRERLLRFIGPDAHQVAIHTFHSFSHQLIQDNADYFGYHDLAPVSELETDEILRALVDGLPAGHRLRRVGAAAYYEVPRLRQLFSAMKHEGWSPAEVQAAIAAYIEDIPNRPAFQYQRANAARGIAVGDMKPEMVSEEMDRMAVLSDAVELFEPFCASLKARSRYDYDDMLGWTLQAFAEQPGLLQRYQERYQHILVDEYQDTNGAQNRILHQLAAYWPNPNLFAVGDDDQSIFRFQGASVANVLDFTQRYPSAAVVVLEENYRSSAPILNLASALIAHNQERLVKQIPGLIKELIPRHEQFAASDVMPQLRRYTTPLHEAAHIAAELQALQQAGFPLHQCAVISRDHGQVDCLARLLSARGVPFARKRRVNVLTEEPVAHALRLILAYVAAETERPHAGEGQLFSLLHLDCFKLSPIDCVRLAAGLRQHNRNLGGEPALSWREWLLQIVDSPELAAQLQLGAETQAYLTQAVQQLERWITAAASLPVAVLVERICLEKLQPYQLAVHAQPRHMLDVMHTLLQFVRTEERRNPRQRIAQFLLVWDMFAGIREGLVLERLSGSANAGVQLLTAHGAKGLEFERVWLIGCQQQAWVKNFTGSTYKIPDTLSLRLADEAAIEDARRLFFVGITRAQEHLILCTSGQAEDGKPLAECQFLHELVQTVGLARTAIKLTPEELQVAQQQLLPPPAGAATLPDAALLDELLRDYALSSTHLNTYLRCPVTFYYEHVLRVPSPRSEYLFFGNSIHHALEHCFRQAQDVGSPGFPSAQAMADCFEAHFRRIRHELPEATYERFREHGLALVQAYHARHAAAWATSSVVEHTVHRATLPGSGIQLTGKLDRIDVRFDGRGHDVLDYKTGKWKKYEPKRMPARFAAGTLADWRADEKARGGDYWRQAVFYHLLLQHDGERRFTPASVAFEYVEPVQDPGQPTEHKREYVHVTPADEAAVLAQIEAVHGAIRNREFTQGCGQPECAWCQLNS